MKIFKFEVVIIDEDIEDIEQTQEVIENAHYANYTSVEVVDAKEAEIGEWSDDHPLNKRDTFFKELEKLFPVMVP